MEIPSRNNGWETPHVVTLGIKRVQKKSMLFGIKQALG